MDKIWIEEYRCNFWRVAKVFRNGKEIETINRFFSVDEEWIYIYKTVGGTGTGFSRGDLIRKIFIGDCEFEHIEI